MNSSSRIGKLMADNKGKIINSALCTAGVWSAILFGQFCNDHADAFFGIGSWKTYGFLGNSGRSPQYPFVERPYVTDIEGRISYEANARMQLHELCTTYRVGQFFNFVHPQRETCDYALVNDALYL